MTTARRLAVRATPLPTITSEEDAMAAKKYTVLVGCNTPPNDERHEPGDTLYLSDVEARPLLKLDAIEHISETHEHEDETLAAIEQASQPAEVQNLVPDEDGA